MSEQTEAVVEAPPETAATESTPVPEAPTPESDLDSSQTPLPQAETVDEAVVPPDTEVDTDATKNQTPTPEQVEADAERESLMTQLANWYEELGKDPDELAQLQEQNLPLPELQKVFVNTWLESIGLSKILRDENAQPEQIAQAFQEAVEEEDPNKWPNIRDLVIAIALEAKDQYDESDISFQDFLTDFAQGTDLGELLKALFEGAGYREFGAGEAGEIGAEKGKLASLEELMRFLNQQPQRAAEVLLSIQNKPEVNWESGEDLLKEATKADRHEATAILRAVVLGSTDHHQVEESLAQFLQRGNTKAWLEISQALGAELGKDALGSKVDEDLIKMQGNTSQIRRYFGMD